LKQKKKADDRCYILFMYIQSINQFIVTLNSKGYIRRFLFSFRYKYKLRLEIGYYEQDKKANAY